MTMDADEYAQLCGIVEVARLLEGAKLNDYLSSACGDDPALRARVLELLHAGSDEASSDVFAESSVANVRQELEGIASVDDESETWCPDRIADYEVLRELGRGGMGVVYEARQQFPNRRVAIKLLHPMHATPAGLRRFRQEAQLLGRLEHPGIVQIFEAGAWDVGRGQQPFFVMELVQGSDIRLYCEQQELDRDGRVALLAKVCDAVQYAHDQDIIHRDIKPENVLVGERGEPRVLDFGIARLNRKSATLSTFVTDQGQLTGTLAYMAPEQLSESGDAVSTRSDVYALGVLGFELLVGRLPHSIADLSISQAISVLAGSEPPRVGKLDPTLRGDLETVIGKALEQDPERRYARPLEFAADLRRTLDHEPIRARPPTRLYLARKFARRHPALVWGTTATILTLVVGIFVALVLAAREREQRELASANEARAIRSENEAGNGLLQSAQVLVDAGRGRDAAATLRLVPTKSRGVAWRLLHRAAPLVLETVPGVWRFLDDERLVGLGDSGLLVYSLTELRVLRGVFRDFQLRGLGRTTRCGVVCGYDGREVFLLDVETGTCMRRGRILFPLDSKSRTTGTGPPRLPEASDDGRATLWWVAPDRVEISVGGEVVRTIRDVGGDETVQLSFDGRSVVVSRTTDVVLIDLESGSTRLRYAIPPGKRATGFPVEGGVLLVDQLWHGADRVGPRVWRRIAIEDSPAADHVLAVSDPFSTGFREEQRHSVASYPRDGRIISLSWNGYSGCLLRDTESGGMVGAGWLTDEDGRLPFVDSAGNSAVVSPSGTRIAISGKYAPTMIVEIDERDSDPGFDPRVLTLHGHRGPSPQKVAGGWIYHLAVSNDGSLIASAAPQDPLVRVWDVHTGDLLGTLERDCRDPGSWGALMAFRGDDQRLCVTTPYAGRHATLVEWDLLSASATVHRVIEEEANSHLGLLDDMIKILDPPPRARLGKRVQMQGRRAIVTYQPINPHLRDYPVPPEGKRWSYAPAGVTRGVAVSVHPSEDLVAVVRDVDDLPAARQGILTLVDTKSGATVAERPLAFQPWCVAYSPDGSVLAIGTHESRVLLFETKFYTQQLEWKAHDWYVYSIAWIPDGTRLVTVSGDATVRIWDTRPRVVSRRSQEQWGRLRTEMKNLPRDELLGSMRRLGGPRREAARAELIRRAHGR